MDDCHLSNITKLKLESLAHILCEFAKVIIKMKKFHFSNYWPHIDSMMIYVHLQIIAN
jgi:hypothetical protein